MTDNQQLPTYTDPPVVESLIDVRFQRVPGLHPALLGAFWGERREKFPKSVTQPPLDPDLESFGLPTAQFEIMVGGGPPVRVWMLNEAESTLLQLQNDRLIQNWRRVEGGEEYPRFETLSADYRDRWTELAEFLGRNQLGELVPVQCEVTYLNRIDADWDWLSHGGLSGVHRGELGSSPGTQVVNEDLTLVQRFRLQDGDGKPFGRAYVAVEPVPAPPGTPQPLMLRLTVKGVPPSADLDGIMNFLHTGREWVVRTFREITPEHMQIAWGVER